MVTGLIQGDVRAGSMAPMAAITSERLPALPKATNRPTNTAKIISMPCTKSVQATASSPPAEVYRITTTAPISTLIR